MPNTNAYTQNSVLHMYIIIIKDNIRNWYTFGKIKTVVTYIANYGY